MPELGGDLVLDGRAIGLTRESAEQAWRRALGQAAKYGQRLPMEMIVLLADGTTLVLAA